MSEKKTHPGVCVVCGRPKAAAHHVAGRVNVPDAVVDACTGHHAILDALLRLKGVSLRHAREPTEVEILYASVAGLGDVFAVATALVGEQGAERAAAMERFGYGIRRLILAIVPMDERRFGPDPIHHATPGGELRLERALPPACPADPIEPLGVIFDLLFQVVQALPWDAAQLRFLERLGTAVRSFRTAARRLCEAGEDVLPDGLEDAGAAMLGVMRAAGEVLCDLDILAPSDDDFERVRSVGARLFALEQAVLNVLSALAAARDKRELRTVLERFVAEVLAGAR